MPPSPLSSSSTSGAVITAAAVNSLANNLTVQLRLHPAPTSLTQTRPVLKFLQSHYGEVTMFRSLLHAPSPRPAVVYVTFAHQHSYEALITASKLTIPVPSSPRFHCPPTIPSSKFKPRPAPAYISTTTPSSKSTSSSKPTSSSSKTTSSSRPTSSPSTASFPPRLPFTTPLDISIYASQSLDHARFIASSRFHGTWMPNLRTAMSQDLRARGAGGFPAVCRQFGRDGEPNRAEERSQPEHQRHGHSPWLSSGAFARGRRGVGGERGLVGFWDYGLDGPDSHQARRRVMEKAAGMEGGSAGEAGDENTARQEERKRVETLGVFGGKTLREIWENGQKTESGGEEHKMWMGMGVAEVEKQD